MRLIDADALIEALVMWRDNDPHRKIRTLWERWVRKTGINVLIKVVSVFPTIEAVPVVRCKNCKWWNKAGCAISIVDETDKPKADDYCSFGERKDGE